MLDIKFIRENLDIVKAGAKKKHIEVDLDRLITVDDQRRVLKTEIETMTAQQNKAVKSKPISEGGDGIVELLAEMRALKEQIKLKEEELKPIVEEWQRLMVQVPNVPDISVPEGDTDAENKEIKTWGTVPTFDFVPKGHVELMEALNMLDIERGTKVAGFRGYFLKGDGARLASAILRYTEDTIIKKGFIPMMVPSLVRRINFLGTGYIPQAEEDLFKTQDDLYLAGTGEVATMGYYMGEILDKKDLPIKLAAYSPCFRREIGAHGKDTKGIIRVHEFHKWEQVILCEGSHEESVKWHEHLTENAEEILQGLELPYHIVLNCGGDIGLGQVKKYDLEAWVPSEEKYRETHSASYFHDFQTRRLNIRYRDDDGTLKFVHSLNNTALAIPRILVPIVENYQQADGTIRVPRALQPYLNKEVISKL